MQPALAPAPHILPPASIPDNNATEQVLRERLLAHSQSSTPPQRTHGLPDLRGNSPVQQQIQNIDPAIASSSMMGNSPGESGGDDNGSDGKKGGKRELSTSKRAAQNRQAQRAFRQRKEGHIKKLEEQVRDYNLLHENYKAVQAENYQLRDYIINLQSRLIESQGDYPPAPSNIELQQPRNGGDAIVSPHPPPLAPTAPMTSAAMSQVIAAQAVADLSEARRGAGFEGRARMDVKMQDLPEGQLGQGTAVTSASV